MGVPANDPPALGMLRLKPGVMGVNGCCSKPPMLGWEKSRGLGELVRVPAGSITPHAASPSSCSSPRCHLGRRPSKALWCQPVQPLASWGSHSGCIPPILGMLFLQFLVTGAGGGNISIMAGPRGGRRVPTLHPTARSIRIRPPRAASHPAWGPGKRRRRMSWSQGGWRRGSNASKPQEKILYILRKCW